MTKEMAEYIVISRLDGSCDSKCHEIIDKYKDNWWVYLFIYDNAIADDSMSDEDVEELYNQTIIEFQEIFSKN